MDLVIGWGERIIWKYVYTHLGLVFPFWPVVVLDLRLEAGLEGAAGAAVLHLPVSGHMLLKVEHLLVNIINRAVLYYTILYYTVLYYTILYYTTYTILYYTILYYTILYYTILYYTILYYTILYYTAFTRVQVMRIKINYDPLPFCIQWTVMYSNRILSSHSRYDYKFKDGHVPLCRWDRQQTVSRASCPCVGLLPSCDVIPRLLLKIKY